MAILRSCSFIASGVAGCELYRRYDGTLTLPVLSVTSPPSPPTVIVNHSNDQYTKYIPLGILGAGLLYMLGGRNYVNTQQFKKAYHALQTQVTGVSKALVNVKTKVLEKFGIVETRLDDIERTVLSKSAEIKRDVAHVETMLVSMGEKVDKIDNQTKRSATGIDLLCSVVAENLANTLQNKDEVIEHLNKHKSIKV